MPDRLAAGELRRIVPAITFAGRGEVGEYLRRYGLDLDGGDYRCAVCGRRVTSGNLGILIRGGGRAIVVCNRPECMARADILALYAKALRA